MSAETPSARPGLTAEQALRGVLELIRTSKSVSQLTPDRLEKAMGVPVKRRSDGYGYTDRLTPQWVYDFSMQEFDSSNHTKGMRFEFSFDATAGAPFPMTDICRLDFDHFTAELEVMGYIREPYYDSAPPADMGQPRLPHGRLMYDSFSGPGLYIEVYPRGEANDTLEKIGHDCVKMLFIY